MNDLVLGQEATLDLFELHDLAERFPARRKNIFSRVAKWPQRKNFPTQTHYREISCRAAIGTYWEKILR